MGLRRIGLGAAALAVVALACLTTPAALVEAAGGGSPPACDPGPMPFAQTPGADLTSAIHASRDAEPFEYVMWRGTVPSFDGLPLSVDVTVPCRGAAGPMPTVAMLHGFTDDKTVWEETGKSDTAGSEDRPGPNSRWNNIWFASRGYATLTYTARGWRDSCGPDTPGGSDGTLPPRCAGHEYWIHLDDKRWEVRDAQWLTAALVADGTAAPERLAITGGSYGGAATASAALLAGQTMCGADPVPAELAPDPCAGKADGDLVPWTTPDGSTELSWAAALPLYTFSDLLRVLAPNGRWTDGTASIAASGRSTEPFGVPLQSTVSGLILAGEAFGAFAPPGTDPASDVIATTDRLLAGDPYDPADPAVADPTAAFTRFTSPISTEPQGRVPVFLVQGFTDALFPASEAIAMVDHLRAAEADYPVKAFFGDIGHDYAAERQDDWDLVKAQMNAFVDHYLDPGRTPEPPTFDVGASVTRCLPVDAPQTTIVAASWGELHDGDITFESDETGSSSTGEPGQAGAATDPISGATLPGPASYKGCRIVEPSEPDPTVVTYEFEVGDAVTLMGGPVVRLDLTATGPDAPVAVRVWDVETDGSAQALVTRGVYRLEQPVPDPTQLAFQLRPQAYRFAAGHRIKVEVTANDAPYLLANNQPSTIAVQRLSLELPTWSGAGGSGGAGGAGPTQPPSASSSDPAPWLWALVAIAVAAVVGDLVLIARRSPRPPAG